MLRVCKEFVTHYRCEELAVFACIDGGAKSVESLRQSNPRISSSEVAFRVLKMWKRQKGVRATTAELHRILKCDLAMPDVGEIFALPRSSFSSSDEDNQRDGMYDQSIGYRYFHFMRLDLVSLFVHGDNEIGQVVAVKPYCKHCGTHLFGL